MRVVLRRHTAGCRHGFHVEDVLRDDPIGNILRDVTLHDWCMNMDPWCMN